MDYEEMVKEVRKMKGKKEKEGSAESVVGVIVG